MIDGLHDYNIGAHQSCAEHCQGPPEDLAPFLSDNPCLIPTPTP
jgi:hypothetical protein